MVEIRLLREPHCRSEGIECFTSDHSSDYVVNYETISSDHLAADQQGNGNPWIPEEEWTQFEQSTLGLLSHVPEQPVAVLDVGVGTGRILKRISAQVKFGVDISTTYLRALAGSDIRGIRADAEDLPLVGGQFDLVVTTDTLEHVKDLNRASAECVRQLKDGGFLLIRVPFQEDLSGYLRESYPYKYAHLRNFDEESLILHFTRIFGLEHVATAFSPPMRQGMPRFRVRPPTRSTIAQMGMWLTKHEPKRNLISAHSRKSREMHPLYASLNELLHVSLEDLHKQLEDFSTTTSPEELGALEEFLIMPMEISCLFRKQP
jgi:SAM-dependent methyltransferase